MSTSLYKTFAQAYGIEFPWGIHKVGTDTLNTNMIVLHVSNTASSESAPQPLSKGWFKRRTETSTPLRFSSTQRWRAQPLGLKECFIQLHLQEDEVTPEVSWSNLPKRHFTRAYEAKLVESIVSGLTLTDICKTHELPLQHVWSLKFEMLRRTGTDDSTGSASKSTKWDKDNLAPSIAINNGATSLSMTPQQSTPKLSPVPHLVTAPSLTDVQLLEQIRNQPMLLHPFIVGEVEISTSDFGLQLLLSQLQRRVAGSSDTTTILIACDRLSMYLHKHGSRLHSLLQHLQASLSINIRQQMYQAQTRYLPAQTDPVWGDILDDRAPLDVSSLNLQLLLTQLKRSQGGVDGKAKQIQELRRFFQLNHRSLAREVEQLGQERNADTFTHNYDE